MERSSEIEQLVRDWFAAASRGDSSAVDQHVTADPAVRVVGSDPGEWIQGGEKVAEFLRGEVEGAAGEVTFTPSEIEGYRHGDVGWAATKLTISLSDGRRVQPRWTAVVVDQGGWKFVQTHASIAVPNDQVGWTYAG
jgi:ketosteroid isomerase-like protein